MIAQPLIELVQRLKGTSYKYMPDGMQPAVILCAEDGHPTHIVVAEHCDKYEGLNALSLCRKLLDFHTALFVIDSRMRKIDHEDAANDPLCNAYEQGAFAKAVEDGQQEDLGIIDCLVVNEVSEDGLLSSIVLEYQHAGSDLQWTGTTDMGNQMGGFVAHSIVKIMAEPSEREDIFVESRRQALATGRTEEDVDDPEFIAGVGSGILKFFGTQGFTVLVCE